jgi:L-seryl-tRNA(Ser) seleniumtransferase
MNKEILKDLPSVEELLNNNSIRCFLADTPRVLVVEAIRDVLDQKRKNILSGQANVDVGYAVILEEITNQIIARKCINMRRVINATGVVLHTGLGRGLIADKAKEALIRLCTRYCNLEFDLETNSRGHRNRHIENLIAQITRAESGFAVNNNAAAVMLALNTFAKNKETIVSRGHLVEIGGSFRLPEVINKSGTKLVEIGTTNKTYLCDYESAITENTACILFVHTSNFKIDGFTEEVDLPELVKLSKKYNLKLIHDLGSGAIIDLSKYGFDYEPTVKESIDWGVDLVLFSGDKLFGGAQAGIIAGKKDYVRLMEENQLSRALRIDKLRLAVLEATLRIYLDEETAVKEIPHFRMMFKKIEDLEKEAEYLAGVLNSVIGDNVVTKQIDGVSQVGGGSLPGVRIATKLVEVRHKNLSADELSKKLRLNQPAILTIIRNDAVLFDLRTLIDGDIESIREAFTAL